MPQISSLQQSGKAKDQQLGEPSESGDSPASVVRPLSEPTQKMSNSIQDPFKLPPEQQAIRAKCFHPSGTFVEFSKEKVEQSIPERFEKISCRYSNQLAIKAGNTFLTYEELNEQANRIAHSILNSVGEGNRPVAILMEHGASIVTAILAALKAGKIYVPLDPYYPVERLRNQTKPCESCDRTYKIDSTTYALPPIGAKCIQCRRVENRQNR